MNPTPAPKRHLPWRLVPICLLAGLAVATIVALRLPARYTSTSTLMVAPKLVVPGQMEASGMHSTTDQLLMLASSEAVVRRVMDKLAEGSDATVEQMERPQMQVQMDRHGMLVMSATSGSFDLSRRFAVAWANEFRDFRRQMQRAILDSTGSQIQQQILLYERRLENAGQALDDFRRKHNLAATSAEHLDGRTLLNAAMTEHQRLVAQRNELENTKPQAYAPYSDRVLELSFEVKKAENRLAAATEGTAETDLNALKAEVALKRADLEAYLTLVRDLIGEKIADLRLKEAHHSKAIEQRRTEFFAATDMENQHTRLAEDERNVRENLTALKKHYESMGRWGGDDEEFLIVSAGMGDAQPSGPNRPLIAFSGLLLGTVLGLGLVLLRRVLGNGNGPHDPPVIPVGTTAAAH